MRTKACAAWATGGAALLASALLHGGCTVVNSFPALAPEPNRGVIVVGATVTASDPSKDQDVLTAVNPYDGTELRPARLPMTVAGGKPTRVEALKYYRRAV